MHALFRTFLPRILVSYFHYGKKTERINLFISCYNTFQKLESEAFYNRAKCNPNNPNSNLDKSTLTLNEWYSFGIQNYKNGVVKPSTIQNYCCIYNNHIKKFFRLYAALRNSHQCIFNKCSIHWDYHPSTSIASMPYSRIYLKSRFKMI